MREAPTRQKIIAKYSGEPPSPAKWVSPRAACLLAFWGVGKLVVLAAGHPQHAAAVHASCGQCPTSSQKRLSAAQQLVMDAVAVHTVVAAGWEAQEDAREEARPAHMEPDAWAGERVHQVRRFNSQCS